jgi:hypothetical protein
MLRSTVGYFRRNVVGFLALFVALGGTAYAVNTVGSSDIIDGQVKSVDVGDAEIKSADVKDESLTTFDVSTFLGVDVVDGTLTSADIQNFSLGNGDFLTGSVDSRVLTDNSVGVSDIGSQQVASDEVLNNSLLSSDISSQAVGSDEVTDNSLTGTDINESALNMPPTTTAGFTTVGVTGLQDAFTKVASKFLAAGSYAVTATANTETQGIINNGGITDVGCELRNSTNGVIGGTRDRRDRPAGQFIKRSLSMNGGAQVPAGGGEISLWCSAQAGSEFLANAQMMFIRLDGFF